MSHEKDLPEPACPVCGEHPRDASVDRAGGTKTGRYVCPADHIWSTKWLLPLGGVA